jgi:hypothetical protein
LFNTVKLLHRQDFGASPAADSHPFRCHTSSSARMNGQMAASNSPKHSSRMLY